MIEHALSRCEVSGKVGRLPLSLCIWLLFADDPIVLQFVKCIGYCPHISYIREPYQWYDKAINEHDHQELTSIINREKVWAGVTVVERDERSPHANSQHVDN